MYGEMHWMPCCNCDERRWCGRSSSWADRWSKLQVRVKTIEFQQSQVPAKLSLTVWRSGRPRQQWRLDLGLSGSQSELSRLLPLPRDSQTLFSAPVQGGVALLEEVHSTPVPWWGGWPERKRRRGWSRAATKKRREVTPPSTATLDLCSAAVWKLNRYFSLWAVPIQWRINLKCFSMIVILRPAPMSIACLLINNSQWLSSQKTVAQSSTYTCLVITFLLRSLVDYVKQQVLQSPVSHFCETPPRYFSLQCQQVEVAYKSQNTAQSIIFMLQLNPLSSWCNFSLK